MGVQFGAGGAMTAVPSDVIWQLMRAKMKVVSDAAETDFPRDRSAKVLLDKLFIKVGIPTTDTDIANEPGDLCYDSTNDDIYYANTVCHDTGALTTTWAKFVD